MGLGLICNTEKQTSTDVLTVAQHNLFQCCHGLRCPSILNTTETDSNAKLEVVRVSVLKKIKCSKCG